MAKAGRRSNGEGSIDTDERGRFVGRVMVAGHRRKVYGRTRAEVLEKLRELDRTPLRDTVKVGELVDRVLALEVGRIEHAGGNPETLKWRRRMLAHFDGLRRRPLANLRSADVGATLEAMARAGLSRSTITRARIEFAAVLEWARNEGLIAKNVAKSAGMPAGITETRERRSLTLDELGRVRAAAVGSRLEQVLEVAVGLCLRPGELGALRWCDIDAGAGTVRIEHALAADGSLAAPKTPKSRATLKAPPSVMAALEAQRSALVRLRERRLAAGQPWANLDLVFPTRSGTPTDQRNLAAQLAVVSRHAAVSPSISPNELRHTGASLLLAQGLSKTAVARFLRHTSTRMLDTRYGHELGPAIDIGADDVLAFVAL